MSLTVSQLREFGLGAALSDAALEALLNAAYAAIDQRVAQSGDMLERFSVTGPMLILSRAAFTVSSITENGVTLSSNDYEVRGAVILRLSTGTHPSSRWRSPVDVSYVPVEGDELRDSVALQLVRLDLNAQHGLASQSIGDWSETYEQRTGMGYGDQREAILSTLREPAYIL